MHKLSHIVPYLFLTYYFIKEPQCVFLEVEPPFLQARRSAGLMQRAAAN